MGSSNNRNTQQPAAGRANTSSSQLPPPQQNSGSDPRGTIQNLGARVEDRYNNQQGPLADTTAFNYGRGSESNYADYTDIMNNYRDIASGGGSSGGSSGGGGGGGYSAPSYTAFHVTPERVDAGKLNPIERVKASDPFQAYSGYQEFSRTGGYSPADISNMRARGIAPVRAAYANAEREVGRQRSLQGGYSPNAAAIQAKMAREQSQSMADASQNVEAGLAQARNTGRLAGLSGMSGIDTSRLGAQMQADTFNSGQALNANQFDLTNALNANQFNANLGYQGQVYNANADSQAQSQNNAAAASAAAGNAAAAAASTQDRLRALSGMTALYGTNPGMSETFGNQAISTVGQGGNFGLGLMGQTNAGQQLPGQFDQTMNRIGQISGAATAIGAPVVDYLGEQQRRRQQATNTGVNGGANQPQPDWYGD
jgi:hypothetical protein